MHIPLFDSFPHPAKKRIAVHVTPAAERAIKQGHPWLFDQGIRKQSHEGQAGDLAVIFDKKRQFLAIGLYDPQSPIRVKILQHRTQVTINHDWLADKLAKAIEIRRPLAESSHTNGYRLIYGENDGLPGLIVDRYVDTLVVKLYTMAWIPHLRDVLPTLLDLQPASQIVLRLARNIQKPARKYDLQDGQVLFGDSIDAPIVFHENGLKFSADVIHGHKTGFFFDHRDNRARVRDLSQSKQVLDVFAYNGGFSLYAGDGGAESVLSLDISEPALKSAEANFTLNQDRLNIANTTHDIMVGDAFDSMAQLARDKRHFDLIVVDPPSFAKRQNEVDGALIAYTRLAELALDLLRPQGILVMASCSSRVNADVFFDLITNTIQRSNRDYDEIARTRHALDHPIGFPEGAYLKCLFARIS